MDFPEFEITSDALHEQEQGFGQQVTLASEQIVLISRWVDAHPPNRDASLTTQLWARCGKVGEEFGEVVAEIIRHTGQNPRKGGDWVLDNIDRELCDVILTALGAMQHLRDVQEFGGGNVLQTVFNHIESTARRAGVG